MVYVDWRRISRASSRIFRISGSCLSISFCRYSSWEEYRQKLMDIQYQFYQDCPFVCLYFRTGNVITRYMYTACRDIREYELLRGIESFFTR